MDPSLSDNDEDEWHLASIQQRASRLNAKPIGSVVKNLMRRRGYGQTQASDRLASAWATAVGEELASVSRPGNISKGNLIVFVANSACLQELHLRKRQVMRSLQAQLPEMGLKDIRPRIQ